ncbi:hypothetical protein BT63DRAFT_452259 [Microthyrium microscopicum]|uniref:Uncharacterized protein n=1 Tax=Microthyrium microscopicum TaxID=703497 RepID=A0A6A6UJU6_9PEZI|nr:hypothetical protein BT63DRAFT_452259 [Microthyrium microscopicum]
MAIWPFGKRSRRESQADELPTNIPPSHPPSEPAPSSKRRPSKGSNQRSRRGTASTKQGDTGMMQSSTLDPIAPVSPMNSQFAHRRPSRMSQNSVEDITALPQSRRLRTSPHLRPATRETADIPYDFRLQSSHSRLATPNQPLQMPPGHSNKKSILSRTPSQKRIHTDINRKLSKKRRGSDPVREEEIRIMSAPAVSPRPRGRGDGGILRKDSKRLRDGLNRNFDNPVSNISLPRPDSGMSSRHSGTDGRMYRISIRDMLSPRPVIKVSDPYMMNTGYPHLSSKSVGAKHQQASSGKEPVKKGKRVDDIADDLDSGELRAAMERETRRKEKKGERDAEKLRRRLERRAEKDRAREEAGEDGTDHDIGPADVATTGVAGTVVAARAGKRHRERRRTRSRSRSGAERPAGLGVDAPQLPEISRDTPMEDVSEPTREPFPQLQPVHEQPSPLEHPQTSREHHNIPEDPRPSMSSPEPVLDFGSVEAPEEFMPSKAVVDSHVEHSTPEEPKQEHRVSPLLPTDSDEIPGLPLLGMGSDIETPVSSPFASSFPSHLHDAEVAVPPTIHRDPIGKYSSFSPQMPQHANQGMSEPVTALPQVPESIRNEPVNVEEEVTEKKRKRRPSLLLSFFRRGDKRKSRDRSTSDATSNKRRSDAAFKVIWRDDQATPVEGHGTQAIPSGASHQRASLSQDGSSRIAPSVRSHSRFQEDLPGLKIHALENNQLPSPPESRVHSPHPDPGQLHMDLSRGAMITPISHHRISEQSAYDPEDDGPRGKSPGRLSNPLTRSLASVDSEGSWLTGKPAKRGLSSRSGTLRSPASLRESVSQRNSDSHRDHRQSGRNTPTEDAHETVIDDDYYRRLTALKDELHSNEETTPQRYHFEEPSFVNRTPSGEVGARGVYGDLADEPGTNFKVYGELARQPAIKKGIRIQSSEGLLKDVLAAGDSDAALSKELKVDHEDDGISPGTEEPLLQRATSVKHTRTPSAKLVEVSRKGSTEPLNTKSSSGATITQ